ncbi:O-antigen ligase family protein [Salinimicrobium terrae]|uniref:O-antigen ligase family protein n=1 Tax=Salinimicrobium terrae TaxID=470866 RepID=UPI000491BDA0|nr:O-antigen ligase family protein [Salinimicrobium terrae]
MASNLSPSLSFAQNFRFLALGGALLYLFYNKGIPKNPGNYILPFAIYATFISLIFSPLGFDAVLRGLAYWLIAIVIFTLYEKSYFNFPASTSQIILGFLILVFGLNSLLIFGGPEMYLVGRFRGVMGNPNELGLIAAFSYGIIDLLKSRNETDFSRRGFLLLKIILVAIIIFTGSRTALFGLILYEITFRLFQNKLLLAVSLLTLGTLYYISLSIDPVAIIQSLGLSQELRVESLITGSGRTEVWKIAWEEIKLNPWFGQGMLYDQYFIEEYVDQNLSGVVARHWAGIWNSYLSLLMDVGIIGLVAFFFFIYKVFNLSNQRNLAAAFLVLTLFAGITESWMAASMNAFTPMFMLYWAIQSHPVNDPEEVIEE